MTVQTNSQLLRKNFTVQRMYKRVKNSRSFLPLMLQLQVKHFISLFMLYPKKRFFFFQALGSTNCFNQFMSEIAVVKNTKNRFFFFYKNRFFLSQQRVKKGSEVQWVTVRNPARTRIGAHSVRLFWALVFRQKIFSNLLFGLLSHYGRNKKVFFNYDSFIRISKVVFDPIQFSTRRVLSRFRMFNSVRAGGLNDNELSKPLSLEEKELYRLRYASLAEQALFQRFISKMRIFFFDMNHKEKGATMYLSCSSFFFSLHKFLKKKYVRSLFFVLKRCPRVLFSALSVARRRLVYFAGKCFRDLIYVKIVQRRKKTFTLGEFFDLIIVDQSGIGSWHFCQNDCVFSPLLFSSVVRMRFPFRTGWFFLAYCSGTKKYWMRRTRCYLTKRSKKRYFIFSPKPTLHVKSRLIHFWRKHWVSLKRNQLRCAVIRRFSSKVRAKPPSAAVKSAWLLSFFYFTRRSKKAFKLAARNKKRSTLHRKNHGKYGALRRSLNVFINNRVSLDRVYWTYKGWRRFSVARTKKTLTVPKIYKCKIPIRPEYTSLLYSRFANKSTRSLVRAFNNIGFFKQWSWSMRKKARQNQNSSFSLYMTKATARGGAADTFFCFWRTCFNSFYQKKLHFAAHSRYKAFWDARSRFFVSLTWKRYVKRFFKKNSFLATYLGNEDGVQAEKKSVNVRKDEIDSIQERRYKQDMSTEDAVVTYYDMLFLLPLLKFRTLFVQRFDSSDSWRLITSRFKFYNKFIVRSKNCFSSPHKRFWLAPKMLFLRNVVSHVDEVAKQTYDYGQLRRQYFSEFLQLSVRRTVFFYTLFKKEPLNGTFYSFMTNGVDFIHRSFCRKRRIIKRRINVVTLRVNVWNSFTVVRLLVFKIKRKPFSKMKMDRMEAVPLAFVHIQKFKLYSRIYQIVTKFAMSFRLTRLWIRLYGSVVIFSVQQLHLLDRGRLRALLNSVQDSFYLRYYKNKKRFLNALIFILISMRYRSPYLLNKAFCNDMNKLWKHRVHIFDTFALITAALWRTTFSGMSSDINIQTVYMQINGKVNSKTRTKHFKLRVDYKPSLLTLQNSLSFDFATAQPPTGTFGIKTWFGY